MMQAGILSVEPPDVQCSASSGPISRVTVMDVEYAARNLIATPEVSDSYSG